MASHPSKVTEFEESLVICNAISLFRLTPLSRLRLTPLSRLRLPLLSRLKVMARGISIVVLLELTFRYQVTMVFYSL